MSEKLVEYEINLLRHMNGENVPGLMWGAAMGECIENLKCGGYVRLNGDKYIITDKGRAALAEDTP